MLTAILHQIVEQVIHVPNTDDAIELSELIDDTEEEQEEEEKRIVFQESQFIEVELTSKKSFFTIPNVLLQLDVSYFEFVWF